MDRKTIYLHVLKRTAQDEACCALLERLDKLDRDFLSVLESLTPEQYAIYLKYQQARDNMTAEMLAVAYEMGLEERLARQ